MKAEKTPLRYIVQRIMRTIFNQDRQEGVATAGGYDNTFAVADCEVRGSSCLTVIIIARSNCAVKRYRTNYHHFLQKRERQLGVLGGRVFVYSQSFTFLHLDLGKSRK